MNMTMYDNYISDYVVEQMYSDTVVYFKDRVSDYGTLKQVFQTQMEIARLMFRDGAKSVVILVKRDCSIVTDRNDIVPMYDPNGVVFRYELRINAHQLYDVARYDYTDEFCSAKDVKEECGFEYKGITYMFSNAYERDLAEAMSRLVQHSGQDVSGTEFGNMIKYVFRLLDVKSDWSD